MVELTKLLSRVEEALKNARAAQDVSLQANEDLGREVAKKDTDIKKARTDLTSFRDRIFIE